MHYVLIAEHGAQICPTSNPKTREILIEVAPRLSEIAESCSVKLVAGPYTNREHSTVMIVEAATGEDLDQFIVRSRFPQWNNVRVIPSLPLEEGVKDIQAQPIVF